MIFHKDPPEDSLEPCKHMESMLNRTADGTAPKLMEMYARSHAARCTRCGRFLSRLTALLGGLRKIKVIETDESPVESLGQERWQALEAQWAEIEK